MSELDSHYSPSEELELLSGWFQELWRCEPAFAEQIILSLIPEPQQLSTLDKTE